MILMKRTFLIPLILTSLAFLAACGPGNEYQRLYEREMASGIRHDSLFLGYYFGMTADSFFKHCFQLNKEGLIKEGMAAASVQYEPEEFNKEVFMYFYPTFDKETREITDMPVMFTYQSWAPWNKQYSADSLLPKVLDMFTGWYGGEFIEVTHPEKGTVHIAMQGNRRIRAFVRDLQYVQVFITDMSKVTD